jgi:hypothetical protein
LALTSLTSSDNNNNNNSKNKVYAFTKGTINIIIMPTMKMMIKNRKGGYCYLNDNIKECGMTKHVACLGRGACIKYSAGKAKERNRSVDSDMKGEALKVSSKGKVPNRNSEGYSFGSRP